MLNALSPPLLFSSNWMHPMIKRTRKMSLQLANEFADRLISSGTQRVNWRVSKKSTSIAVSAASPMPKRRHQPAQSQTVLPRPKSHRQQHSSKHLLPWPKRHRLLRQRRASKHIPKHSTSMQLLLIELLKPKRQKLRVLKTLHCLVRSCCHISVIDPKLLHHLAPAK